MHFTKMQGLGNDYLYYYGDLENPEELSKKLSDRHFGIGSDGIITISKSDAADFKMRIFNADGSEARMCGNGIRCVGKYVFDKGYTDKKEIDIETLSGIKHLELHTLAGKVSAVTVNMGKCQVDQPLSLAVKSGFVKVTPVDMGNPHAVHFVESAENANVAGVGSELEHHCHFKDGVNVEFTQVIDRRTLKMRVWERGSGITMACGTGACAAVAAAIKSGFCDYDSDITVQLDGGDLKVKIFSDNTVMMTGPAQTVCECEV